MKVGVVGLGYVGLIQSVGLAKLGHDVHAVDISIDKITKLKNNESPLYEDGLDNLLCEVNNKINYSSDIHTLVGMDFIFLCVGTPERESGETDLSYIHSAVKDLYRVLEGTEIIVIKSTVPVGTNDLVYQNFYEKHNIVSNPEFLKEGQALKDFFEPDRIILGFHDLSHTSLIEKTKDLYAYFVNKNVPFLITDHKTAELIKYASNAYLACKISFINEIAKFCDKVGANVKDVACGMGLDPRIGNAFLNAGLGYGGSCFPKDVRSLVWQCVKKDIDISLLSSIDDTNNKQTEYFIEKIIDTLGDVTNKKIALIGIAFKPNTDDLRESRGMLVLESLLKKGAYIHVFDYTNKALDNFILYNKISDVNIKVCDTFPACIQNTDAIILTVEDPRLNFEDWEKIDKYQIVFDGKNVLNLDNKKCITKYIGIGI